jgi:hypothetical protein
MLGLVPRLSGWRIRLRIPNLSAPLIVMTGLVPVVHVGPRVDGD